MSRSVKIAESDIECAHILKGGVRKKTDEVTRSKVKEYRLPRGIRVQGEEGAYQTSLDDGLRNSCVIDLGSSCRT